MYTVEICCGEYYNVLAVFINKQLAIDYAYYYAGANTICWMEGFDDKCVKVIDGEHCVLSIPY